MKTQYAKKVLLSVLLFLFSFQLIRVFLASAMWRLLTELGNPLYLSVYALGLFLLSFALIPLVRFAGERKTFLISAAGIIAARFAVQLVHNSLAVSFISSAGIVFFEWFLALVFRSDFNRDRRCIVPVLAAALPIAVLFDTAVRTLLSCYDFAWRAGSPSAAAATILCASAAFLLYYSLHDFTDRTNVSENGFFRSLQIAVIGPWLYISMVLLQNQTAFSVLTGMSDRAAGVVLTLCNAAGLLICVSSSIIPSRLRLIRGPLSGIVFSLSVYAVFLRAPYLSLWLSLAVLSSWAAFGTVLAASDTGDKKGISRSSFAVFAGFLVMLVMIFLHAQLMVYGALVAAAVCIGIGSAFASSFSLKQNGDFKILFASCIAVALLVAGDISYRSWNLAEPVPASHINGSALTVVTYNIHQGLDQQMTMDLDGIADVIASQHPDIVGLEEVNRAQITNGCTDVLLYLSRRLGMSYVYGANYDDRQYGNAVLSRYPVISFHNKVYNVNQQDKRGFLTAVIDCGVPVTIIETHTDYIYDNPALNIVSKRFEQHSEMLSSWQKNPSPHTIIMGDLNAEPDTREMMIFYAEKRLADLLAVSGRKYEKTFWQGWGDPDLKLDYIFTTKDFKIDKADILQTKASDHKPVAAELEIR